MKNKQPQWMIITKSKIWFVKPWRLLWRLAVAAFCVFSVIYVSYLVITASRSEQLRARAATAENGYLSKNASEAERSRQILLFARNAFIQMADHSIDITAKESSGFDPATRTPKVLVEPYPKIAEVEGQLGKADQRSIDAGSEHLVWYQSTWKKPIGWPAGRTLDLEWERNQERILEAWFDAGGRLAKLVIQEVNIDGRSVFTQIGRLPSDWRILR